MSSCDCPYREKIGEMHKKVEKIDQNVETLLNFKNKIMGGIILVSFLSTVGVTVVFNIYNAFFK